MRDIKFRIWSDMHKDMYDDKHLIDIEISHKELTDKEVNHNVMQCTGSKDKNKAEIYEGDILSYMDGSEYGEVCYCSEEAQYKIKLMNGNSIGIHALHMFSRTFEVIGNIYENPELLENK